MNLKYISNIIDCAKPFSTSTRISITFSNNGLELGLKFSSGGKDAFTSMLTKTLSKKSWEKIIAAGELHALNIKSDSPHAQFSVTNAGVGGIMRRQEKAIETIDNVTKSALSDLDALMNQVRADLLA